MGSRIARWFRRCVAAVEPARLRSAAKQSPNQTMGCLNTACVGIARTSSSDAASRARQLLRDGVGPECLLGRKLHHSALGIALPLTERLPTLTDRRHCTFSGFTALFLASLRRIPTAGPCPSSITHGSSFTPHHHTHPPPLPAVGLLVDARRLWVQSAAGQRHRQPVS